MLQSASWGGVPGHGGSGPGGCVPGPGGAGLGGVSALGGAWSGDVCSWGGIPACT